MELPNSSEFFVGNVNTFLVSNGLVSLSLRAS